jgi:hypothetical protein
MQCFNAPRNLAFCQNFSSAPVAINEGYKSSPTITGNRAAPVLIAVSDDPSTTDISLTACTPTMAAAVSSVDREPAQSQRAGNLPGVALTA